MPNPSTPLPRVGEVWGEPNDPFTWHLVELANEYSVVCWTFKGPQLVKDWQSWSRDKQLIKPKEEA